MRGYLTALCVLISMVLVPTLARADGYATDVDDLDLGPLQHHPGAPGQDYWFYAILEGDAVTEVQEAIANPGRAFHLLAPLTNPSNAQTMIRREMTPPDLSALPIVTLSFDFYCNTSDQTAWNLFNANCAILGGPEPGFMITKLNLTAGGGTPRDVTGLDVVVWAYEPDVGGVPIPLTVGQDLSWDTWHSISLSLDQNRDTFLSIIVDGEIQDLQGYHPERTFYEGEWLRGELMELISCEVVSHEWPDPFYETDDHLYIDNFSIQAEPPAHPTITSIADVGNDQGRMVRIKWNRSLYDAPGEPVVTNYDIYRREEDGRLAGWDYVSSVPACGDSAYQSLAPTLCDSTAGGGICWSTFFIRAMTTNPLEYFDSPPDSGYSVDNLAPAPPEGFRFESPAMLAWEDAPEEDFDYFTVYGSESGELDPTAVVIGYTVETTMNIEGHDYPFYHLTATDFAGNEGQPATLGASGLTDGDGLPKAYALHQGHPNPGNNGTVIHFDLPEESRVRLEVFDVTGRRITTLLDGTLDPGRHASAWNARDAVGRHVVPGVYFYRLEAEDYRQTRRLVVIR